MAHAANSSDHGAGIFARLADGFQVIREKLERRRVFVETRAELQALSNAELSDIGLTRTGITRAALEVAYGKRI